MSDKHDELLPYGAFREWEKQARAEADAMLAHFEKIGDAHGVERARAFQAMIDRAVRVATGQRLDDA